MHIIILILKKCIYLSIYLAVFLSIYLYIYATPPIKKHPRQQKSLGLWKWIVGMHVNMPADVTWFVEVDRWNACEHASGCQLVC
jgi:hypothetical protein